MTLTIDLPPALEKDVLQQAARRGQKVSDFVVRAVQAQLAQARTSDATATRPRACRGFSADEVIALLKMPQPAPDDGECQQILEEELLRKYGR